MPAKQSTKSTTKSADATTKASKKTTKKAEETPKEEVEEEEVDEEVDESNNVDTEVNSDDEATKSTKKPTKSKGKVVAKAASVKKETKPKTSKSGTKAKSDETKRYEAAMSEAVKCNYITEFDALKPRSVHEKLGTIFNMYILETVSHLQKNEIAASANLVNGETIYNPFPATKYVLLEEKLGVSGSVGKTVKTKGSKVVSKPTKSKRLPAKRGQKKAVEEPEEDVAEAEKSEEEEEKAEEEETTEDKTEAKKTPAKKNVATQSRNCKNYLAFILTRFVDELYSTDGGNKLRSNEEFTKFVMENLSTENVNTQLIRSIVPVVNRLERTISWMDDHGFPKEIGGKFTEYFSIRSGLCNYIIEYLMKYFKLLAYVVANDLWLNHKGVSGSSIERAMRLLDMGNYEWLVDNKYVIDGESDHGLTSGILNDARGFDHLLNPPVSDEVKAERAAAKRAKGKVGVKADPKAKGKAKSKGKGKAKVTKETDKKSKKSKSEDAEAEAEDDNDAEAEDDNEAEAEDDNEAEAEDDNEAEEDNEDADAEEVEEEPEDDNDEEIEVDNEEEEEKEEKETPKKTLKKAGK
jgi:hypothetical protein